MPDSDDQLVIKPYRSLTTSHSFEPGALESLKHAGQRAPRGAGLKNDAAINQTAENEAHQSHWADTDTEIEEQGRHRKHKEEHISDDTYIATNLLI